MDPAKVDVVIKYALARAAHEDAPWARELGPIHLLKYVFLADLAYAEAHEGHPYTGVQWRFYNYGPWSPAVMDRITSVVADIGAIQSIFQSTRYENDRVRWSLHPDDADELQGDAERFLPTEVTSAIRACVHRYGSDTSALLHHVYATAPMVKAAPNEVLDFRPALRPPAVPKGEPQALTRRQEKKREATLQELKARVREKLEEVRAERKAAPLARPPRYDQVFLEGQKWLDEAAGGELSDTQGEVEFDREVWKSPWRSDPGH